MDDVLQPGHPDADQLNAFMENALPVAEREQTLAHLATCADCRMVVALATGAEDDFPAPVVVVEPGRRPWWRVPVWVWSLPVAAVGVLVFFTVHRGPVIGPSGPQQEQAAVTVSAAPVAPVAPIVVVAPKEKAVERSAVAGGMAAAQAQVPMVAAAPPPPDATAPVPTMAEMAPAAKSVKAPAVVAAAMAPVPAPPPPPPPATPMRNAVTLGRAATAAQPLAAPMATQDAVSTRASMDELASNAVSVARSTAAPKMMTAEAAPKASGILELHPLPSMLEAESMAEGGGTTLALDSGNQLFVTRDGGLHWAAVAPKWKGKAVKVGLAGAAGGERVSGGGMTGFAGAAASGSSATGPVAGLNAPAGMLRGGEGSSSVTGVVKDPTGAAIPEAVVTLKSNGGAVVRTAKTDGQGRFAIGGVTAGGYSLSATMPGFSQEVAAVTVPQGTQFNQNMTLAVGSESQTVAVSASVPLETKNATLAQTLPLGAPAKKLKIAAVAVFELVTENGERWVSGDGVVWVKKK